MRSFSPHSLLQRCVTLGLILLSATALQAASLIFPTQAYYTVGIQDLEANTWTLGASVGGTKVLFVSDPSNDVWFSGNNVRGRLYVINASNEVVGSPFYGEITRLVKIGSTVIACQFYVYPNPANPLDTGSPAQTLLINLSGTFTPGQTIKTSSDPVAAFLNSLLPQVTSPAAVADAATAVEAGGLNNAVPGSAATGFLLANDSGSSTDYSIDNSVSPPLFVETVGGIRVTSIINTAATASPTDVPATGSVTATGLYGSLAINAEGVYTYTIDDSDAAVEALRLATDELQDVFTYTIRDDRGNTSTSVLTVTIDGANDTPIAADDYNFAKESLRTDATAYDGTDTFGYKAEGSVLPNDSDIDRYGEQLALTGLVAGATGTTVSSTVLNISGTTANVKAGYYVFQYSGGTRGAALVTSGGAQIQVSTVTPSITLSATPTVAINNGDTLYFALKADGSGSGGTALVASTSTSSGTNIALNSASLTGVIFQGMSVSGAGVTPGTTVTAVTYAADGSTNGITLSQSASLSGTALTFTAPLGTTLTGRYGTLVLEADGDYIYTPTKNNPDIAEGESVVDAFAYRISDLEAATSDAVLYITVLGSSLQDPDAVADSLAAAEAGGIANGTAGTNPAASGPGLLNNDDTPDGGSLSITAAKSVQTGTATSLTANSVTAPGGSFYDVKLTGLYGDLYLKADGSSLYVVDNSNTAVEALKDGESLNDSFQYKILNSVAGMEDWGLVTVTIAGAYDAPVAVADTAAASDLPTFNPEGQVLLNDTDVDAGDSKTVTRVAVGSVDLSLVPGEIVSPASTSTSNYTELTGSYGKLRIGADGSYVYLLDTLNAAVRALGEGQVMPAPDVFTYEVEDAGGLAGTTTLTVAITGSNDAPVNTLPASVALEAGETFSFTGGNALAVADIDDNLSSLRLEVQNGVLTLNETGASYDPVEGVLTLAGGAKIYYQSTADGSAFVTENGTSGITLYGTQAQINAALASLTYTPDSTFSGDDTLRLLAVDDGALQDLDTLTLSVAAVPTVADVDVNEGSPYVVFTVSGDAGQEIELDWVSGTATSLDYGPGLQYWNGTSWVDYTDGDFVALPASGELLVRTSITSDTENEGAHAFQLQVTNRHGATESGTGTIRDDGTGSYWIADATTPASAGDLTTAGLRLDDDRPLTVSSPTVNESSPYAVFKVCGIEGQLVGLELGETGTDYGDGDAELGADTDTALEYYDPLYDNGDMTYGAWRPYVDGSYVAIPRVGAAFNGEAGCLLVRVALVSDGDTEGAETFTLTAANTGGTTIDGLGTIVDDGTGDIYLADNTDGDPNGPGDTGYPARLDDDRPLTVSSPTVNEASPFAVFKVCGIEGQLIGLELGETGTDYGAGDAELGADTGTALEYYDPLYDNGDMTYGAWRPYTDGSYVAIPRVGAALNGEAGCLLVRVAITNDAPSVFEDAETFTLTAFNTGGGGTVGTGTIVDDGTGDIYLASNTDGDPSDPSESGYPVLDNDNLHIIKWGIAGALPADGRMDATIISNNTTTPIVFAGMNQGRFDLHMATNGLEANGLFLLGGEPMWSMTPRSTAATVRFRFYNPGTTTPHSIRNIHFSIEDAETAEEFSSFSYWDATGTRVDVPWSNAGIFSYSHAPVFSSGDTVVENGAALIGKPQAGKWIRVDLRGIAVTGLQFSFRKRTEGAGTVQVSHLCGEPGKFGFDTLDALAFEPLVVKAGVNDQAPLPDYRSQMTWDAAQAGPDAVVSQSPAPGTSVGLGDHSVTMTLTTADSQTATVGFVMTVRAAKAPLLAVTTPAVSTTQIAALSPYLVTGTVRDLEQVGISRVEVVHNGDTANPLLASVGGVDGLGYASWSLALQPVEGSNQLAITAYDREGFASTTITRSFTFSLRQALEVTAAVTDGSVSVKVAAGGIATRLSLSGALSRYAVRAGSVLTLDALPKAGRVFSHWSGVPEGASEEGNRIVFTMPSADLSGLQAHFVSNPFTAPAGMGTAFYGLLEPVDAADAGIGSVGWLTANLLSSGSFSGSLTHAGELLRFSGLFYGGGNALFTVSSTVKATSLSLSNGRVLELVFNVADGTMTATVTRAGVVSTATLERSSYSAANKVPADLLNRKTRATLPVNNQGFYTVALPSVEQPPLAASSYPQGSGYATVTLADLGTLTMVGTLADGTTFTASTGLVAGDVAPAFARLKTPGASSQLGSLGGHLNFAVGANSDVSSTDLRWIRPAVTQLSGTTATAKATQLYTAGWPSGIAVGLAGALYDINLDAATLLNVPAADAAVGNAELLFHDGKLVGELTLQNFNIVGNAVAKIPTTNSSFTLTLSPRTAGFSGSFTPNWTNRVTAKPAYKGIFVQKGFTGPAGYGFFLSNRSSDMDPESGEVTLGAQDVSVPD